jgi:hypothetical protein
MFFFIIVLLFDASMLIVFSFKIKINLYKISTGDKHLLVSIDINNIAFEIKDSH